MSLSLYIYITFYRQSFIQAHARDVGDAKTGGLNSYAWSLMTIQFLQILDPPVVPVLGVLKLKTTGVTGDDVMKNSPGVKKAIGCDSATTHFRSDNSLTTSQLFRLFHHYYAFVFRPSRYRISVYSGRPLPLDVENGANDVAMEYTGKTRDHKNNNESNVHDLTSHHNHTQRKHTHAHALKIKHIPKLALVVEDPVERQDFPSRTLTSTGLRRLAREHMRVCVCFSLAEQKQTIAQTYAQTCPQAHTGTRDDTPRTCIRGHCSNNGLFLARFSINKINIQSHCHTPSLSASTSSFPSSAVALHSDHTLQWRDIALPLSCLPSIITRGKDRVCSLFFGV